jgi:hypothetical protein
MTQVRLVVMVSVRAEEACGMASQEVTDATGELEQLRGRFEEFRSTQITRGRLPEALWKEAAEAARRYGLNPVAQTLRLDYSRLKKRMAAAAGRNVSKRTKERRPAADFLELIQPVTSAMQDCHIEVETSHGAKLRVELKRISTNELAGLIRGFLGQ